jgi:uncharacterized protein YebE (UPF0316 family)
LTTDDVILVILIFVLRVANNGLGTIRVISMTYGRRGLAFVLGFIESLIFAFTASKVLTDLENIPNLVSYALGFSVGGYLGMWIEQRYVTGYMAVNIISASTGHEIAVALRDNGFGVTEVHGEGVQGEVIMLKCVVHRQQVSEVVRLANRIDSGAFITVEEARTVLRGWVHTNRERTRNTLAW